LKGWQMPQIEVLPDSDALADRAADVFLELANKTLNTSDPFTVAISGGSTPQKMYERLVNAELDWERIHFYWADERCVPPDHPESNYRLANDSFLERIEIPASNIHRVKGELPAKKAALDYENQLREFFPGPIPGFDLILLGLGTDGHTASLFPGSPALEEEKRWVIDVKHDTPPPPLVDRVTLTLPVIKAAKRIIFLVTGIEKAGILARVLNDPYEMDQYPAQILGSADLNSHWLVDQNSAVGLSNKKP
jgi:6-phosphogluconolactonase